MDIIEFWNGLTEWHFAGVLFTVLFLFGLMTFDRSTKFITSWVDVITKKYLVVAFRAAWFTSIIFLISYLLRSIAI